MDLMKCCLSTDVLINMDWLTFEPDRVTVRMPEPDCFLRYRISAATRNFTSGKSHVHVLAAWFLEWTVVLKSLYSLSCRITFVGGTCALPSALLVISWSLIEPVLGDATENSPIPRYHISVSHIGLRRNNHSSSSKAIINVASGKNWYKFPISDVLQVN